MTWGNVGGLETIGVGDSLEVETNLKSNLELVLRMVVESVEQEVIILFILVRSVPSAVLDLLKELRLVDGLCDSNFVSEGRGIVELELGIVEQLHRIWLLVGESFQEVLWIVVLGVNGAPGEDVWEVSSLRVCIARSDNVVHIEKLVFAEVEELFFCAQNLNFGGGLSQILGFDILRPFDQVFE